MTCCIEGLGLFSVTYALQKTPMSSQQALFQYKHPFQLNPFPREYGIRQQDGGQRVLVALAQDGCNGILVTDR